MKIAIAQQNYHIGNFQANTRKIIEAIREAKAAQADIILFSELSVCGYPPRDFLEFDDFIEECQQAIELIKEEADTIAAVVGAPSINPQAEGKNLFNSAYFLYEKKIQQIVHKTLLPTYDVFDEYRYFEPAYEWHVVPFKGKKIAVTVCEDIWNLEEDPMYRFCPMDKLQEQCPDLILNLSASPFDYEHEEKRKSIILQNIATYRIPVVYCNTVGAQTDLLFDGGSVAYNKDGSLLKQFPYFEEALDYIVLPGSAADAGFVKAAPYQPLTVLEPGRNIAAVYEALLMGIMDYFRKMGFTKAIVASSGGIDSAVVLALACAALGSDNVDALLLPSAFSTAHSVNDAVQLSRNLDNKYTLIPIKEVFDAYSTALMPVFKDLPFSVAEENLQSRIRGAMVMALSNKFGSILLNTSNKSELATGYGTLYGDMAGGLGILGDLYKTQVYALAHYINRDKEVIPLNIIRKAPSAELRPGQKDSDSLPDYAVLDAVLYQYIEHTQSPKDIIEKGYDKDLVYRILKLVNTNEYKRNQFCPILRVSPKAFGSGRRVPIVAKYLS